MPFINAALSEAQESEAVPEGTYTVRNSTAEIVDSKSSGKPMVVVMSVIESAEYPNAAPITTYLSLPSDEDDDRARNFKTLQLRRFCEAFEIPFEDSGFDTDDIPGTTGEIAVAQEMIRSKGPDGQPDLSKPEFPVNRLVLPRLSSEPAEEEKKPAGKGRAGSSTRRR